MFTVVTSLRSTKCGDVPTASLRAGVGALVGGVRCTHPWSGVYTGGYLGGCNSLQLQRRGQLPRVDIR